MLHDGQFIISKTPWEHCGVKHLELKNGWVLSYQEKLRVFYDARRNALLLGAAWQTDSKQASPQEELQKLPVQDGGSILEDAILRMEESWCGRYVLIINGEVYLDASGLLNVFYSDAGISCSCALLAAQMGLPERQFQSTDELNYAIAPLTQYPEIRRQLPSQIYNFHTGAIRGRQLLAQAAPVCASEQERIEVFTDMFSVSLHNMQALFPDRKILLALTGGKDSRTALALLEHAGLDYACFTLEHDFISVGDVEIPKQLCQRLGRESCYIKREKNDYRQDLKAAYEQHTAGLANDGDKHHYVHQQYQKLVGKFGPVLLIRSSVWGAMLEGYRRFVSDELDAQPIYDYYEAKKGSLAADAIDAYLAWCRSYPQEGLAACNRFFWEQRTGSWLASIEQSFDLFDGIVSIQPVNCRRFLSLLMQFPKEDRIIKRYQEKIMRYACPAIADIPFGSGKSAQDSRIVEIEKKVKKAVRRLRAMGVRKTAAKYMQIIKIKFEERRLRRR